MQCIAKSRCVLHHSPFPHHLHVFQFRNSAIDTHSPPPLHLLPPYHTVPYRTVHRMYVSYMSGIFDFTGVCLHCPIELIRTLPALGGASCAPNQQLPTLPLSLTPSRGDLSPPPPSLSFLPLPYLLLPSFLPPFPCHSLSSSHAPSSSQALRWC